MRQVTKYIFIFVFSSILAACGGGGGGGGGSSVTPTLPADATTITTTNATTIARSAVDIVGVFGDLLRPDDNMPSSTADVIKLVIDKVFDRNRRSRSIASGVVETEACSSGGSITVNFNETDTSVSGTATFANCREGSVTVNGSASFSSVWNNSTGAYTDSLSGNLTFTGSGINGVIVVSYNETGNENTGSFSSTMSSSVSGTTDANYLLTTTQPIVGSNFNVTSGEILVEGAGGTKLRITVTSTNVASVYLDDGSGTFVFHNTINL